MHDILNTFGLFNTAINHELNRRKTVRKIPVRYVPSEDEFVLYPVLDKTLGHKGTHLYWKPF